MPNLTQWNRLARLEADADRREHRAVLWYADRAHVPEMLAEALRAGRVRAPFGVVVVPVPISMDRWQEAAEALRLRY